MFRFLLVLYLGAFCLYAADPVAARLAKQAHAAQDAGQVVRAYLLFAEAASRDPQTVSYAVNRDAMAPLAKLMTEAELQSADIQGDIEKAIAASGEPLATLEGLDGTALPSLNSLEVRDVSMLETAPSLTVPAGLRDFELRGDERTLLTQVTRSFGIDLVFDPAFDSKQDIHFDVDQMDFRTVMNAVTEATDTFVFPLGPRRLFIARDTPAKRAEFEPQIVLTVPCPEPLQSREVVEAATAVRATVAMHGMIAWDTEGRQVIIRDHVTQARTARNLMEALLLPKAQVSFEFQLMTVDTDTSYTYGISWQNTYQILALGLLSRTQFSILPTLVNSVFLPFGGGASLLGVGLTDANLLANYSHSNSRVLYDATVVVADGQTATLHVGDKYPIPTALYSGATQGPTGSAALYNPIGQVTQEDLGLELKVQPHVHGEDQVGLDVEAAYKSLGSSVLDTVPSINQREFKGSLVLGEGQWAVVGGMQETDHTSSRSGFPGLSQIPGLGQIFTQTTRDDRKSDTLLVIKPTITRLGMSSMTSPQYLVGPLQGVRVLF